MDLKTNVVDYLKTYYDTSHNIEIVLEEICKVCNIGICDNNQKISEKYYIKKIIEDYFDKLERFKLKQIKFKNLLKLELPEQRSPEWFEMRRDKLTASSFATALGEDHYTSKFKLIHDKLTNAPHVSNIHTEWGTKYEEIATLFYQLITRTNVIEFGMIPHPDFPIFGASPDGICDDSGPMEYTARMLEIKCPTRREFWKKSNKSKWMPHHYWMQMQGQMEVCDLDECDFLQVKLEEYEDVGEYEKDLYYTDKLVHGKTKDGLPKGLVIAYRLKDPNSDKYDIEYKYSPWGSSLDEVGNWKDSTIKELNETYSQSDKIFSLYEVKWWKITRYECTLVRRDREWWLSTIPEIIKFWKEVVHYREVGNEEVQKRIDGRKRKPKSHKKVYTVPVVSDEYQMLDTDEEDTK